jgi:hypothetical protein
VGGCRVEFRRQLGVALQDFKLDCSASIHSAMDDFQEDEAARYAEEEAILADHGAFGEEEEEEREHGRRECLEEGVGASVSFRQTSVTN